MTLTMFQKHSEFIQLFGDAVTLCFPYFQDGQLENGASCEQVLDIQNCKAEICETCV